MSDPFVTEDQRLAELAMKGLGLILEAVTSLRAQIEEDRTVAPRDATPFCGHLARAIKREGGCLNNGPHALRHTVEPQPGDPRDPGGYIAAYRLAFEVLACLRKGPGDDAALDRMIAIWPECRSYAEAQKKTEALEGETLEAKKIAEKEAHEKRLAEAARRPPAGPTPAAPKVDAPLPERRPPTSIRPRIERASGPGTEWVEGDNVETNVPTVG
jgi:hypothetical protein